MADEHEASATEVQLAAELASMGALHRVALDLLVAPDEETVYAVALDAIATLQHARVGTAHRVDTDDRLTLVAQRGLDDALVARVAVLGRDEAIARAQATGPREVNAVTLVSARGELVGVIQTWFDRARSPSEVELRLIELHARQASIALARVRAEAALKRSEIDFGQVVNEVREPAIYRLDTLGRVQTWNAGAERLTGYRAEDVVGQHFSLFHAPDRRSHGDVAGELALAVVGGHHETRGWRRKKDGSRFFAEETVSALRDERGRLSGYVKVARDISERQRLQDLLVKSEARHRLIFENIRDYAVFTSDMQGQVTSWNPGAELLFGYGEDEIIGRAVAQIYTPEDRAAHVPETEMRVAARDGRAIDERWHTRKNGSRFFASGIMSPIVGIDNTLQGFVKVCRDLTEVRQDEERRQRLLEAERLARLEAERAVTMRDNFVSVVSHELRTPLAAILLWVRLLRSGAVSDASRRDHAIEAIEQSAVAQQLLIEDLLDIGRAMTGKLDLHVRDVDAVEVVRAAVRAVAPMAENKGVAVRTVLEPGALRLRADPDRLQQVLWNVVQNAVKFTPRGGLVSIHMRRTPEAMMVQVSDTGRGIDPQFLPHVFSMFRQEDSSTTRIEGGLGLGLAIAKNIIELHGGQLSAQSSGLGRGATFTLRLPLATFFAERPPASLRLQAPMSFEPSDRLSGSHVLVVEDDRATREALVQVLLASGAEVTEAVAADDATSKLVAQLDVGGFAAMVVDVAMPARDGYQLMNDVRVLEAGRRVKPCGIVAVTAYATDEARERGIASGANAWLAKPVEAEALVRAVLDVSVKRR